MDKKYLKYKNETNSHIDRFLYRFIIERSLPAMKRLGFTPNIITILGFVLKLYGIYLLYATDHYVIAASLFMAGYIFDCMDGAFARQYDMCSKFGDLLDHTCDVTSSILLLLVVAMKFGYGYAFFIFILFLLQTNHLFCQEATAAEKSDTLFSSMCSHKHQAVKYSFLGCGNMMFLISIFIILIGISPIFNHMGNG